MKKFVTMCALTVLLFTPNVKADELETSELARALGVDWWSIEVPDSHEKTVNLGFCVAFSDGRKEMSSSMSFRPGANVKAFCWPSDQPGRLNVSLVSDTGRMSTLIRYPPEPEQIMTYAVPIGGTAKTGDILRKGSTSGEVTPDQTLREGDFGFMVIAKEK